MIKITTKCSVHVIHRFIRNILVFLSLFIGFLFIWLSIGIQIDTFTFAKYRVEGLYIKLDKKLILKAKKISIPKVKASPNVARIDEILERIKYGLTFFEQIDLKKIHFDNNILGIYYHDNIMQLETKEYLIRGSVHREGKILKGHIPMLYIKEQQITMQGKFAYNLNDESLDIEGTYALAQLSGNFLVSKVEDEVSFVLNSKSFENLKSLLSPFDIAPTIKRWTTEKVRAKRYKIAYFFAKGHIKDKAFRLDKKSLKAKVTFFDTTIDFKKNIAPIKASELILTYTHDKGLVFDLEKPSYLGKDLSGSQVSLHDLTSKDIQLHLNLKFDTIFDKKIQNLLKAYKLNIPVEQKSGTVRASVDIQLGLQSQKISVISDINFRQGKIKIKNIELPIVSGRLHYEKGKITLRNIILKNDTYFGEIDGTLDIKKQELRASFDSKYIRLGEKNKRVFELEKRKIPFLLSYAKKVKIDIPSLEITFKYHKKMATITLNNLKKISPYLSQSIPIKEGGKATISSKDFKTYRFKGMIKRSTCFLFENDGSCATQIPLEGKITPSNVDFYAFDKRIYYNQAKSHIKINDLNIDLKKFLNTSTSEEKDTTKESGKNLVILGKNSHLRYEDYSLLTDSYDVEIKKDGSISAIGSSDGDIIKFSKKEDIIKLQALRIKDKILHPLINFDGLKKGRYSLTKTGNPKLITKGQIIVEGGVMQGFKAYNNALALINTLPALATLHKPGYSDEGFTIKSGLVEYRMIKREQIVFDSIYIEGESATIVGKGKINLKAKTITMHLNIQIARELGKVLGNIPIVGYILVGKDKSTNIGLTITGNLDKPIVNTTAGKDLLNYPINLLKRSLEIPQNLINSKNE